MTEEVEYYFEGLKVDEELYFDLMQDYDEEAPFTSVRKKAIDECINITRNTILMIDETVPLEEYAPEATSEENWVVFKEWIQNPYIMPALEGDLVTFERLAELLNGIECDNTVQQVMNILTISSLLIQETERKSLD